MFIGMCRVFDNYIFIPA